MTDGIDTPAQMMELTQASMTSRSAKALLYEHPWPSCLSKARRPASCLGRGGGNKVGQAFHDGQQAGGDDAAYHLHRAPADDNTIEPRLRPGATVGVPSTSSIEFRCRWEDGSRTRNRAAPSIHLSVLSGRVSGGARGCYPSPPAAASAGPPSAARTPPAIAARVAIHQ